MAVNFSDLAGKMVSLQIYPSSIISGDFSNMKVLGVTTHEGVDGRINPAQLHAQVYPTLPEGTPNDYRLYQYVLFKKPDGSITALGVPWIKDQSVVVLGSIELNVVVRNKTIDDIGRLRLVLMENNFSDITISTTSTNA